MLATELEPPQDSAECGSKPKLIAAMEASPADFPLGSPQSRALARAWAEAKNPKSRKEVQRDQDALELYQMTLQLNGRTYPDRTIIQNLPIMLRAKELRLLKYGPVIPIHECPEWSRWTSSSHEFELCFGREPKMGDLLRWEHVRTMRGPEMNELTFQPQIEAWHRQLADLPCPLKFEDGRLFKRTRTGDWFEEVSIAWQSHWMFVEKDAGVDYPDGLYELLMQPDSDVHSLATMSVMGVTFLGLIDGKHACRPATKEELRQPEVDEFFRESLCSEPTLAAPPGFVWLRNRGSGIYGAFSVEDALQLTEGPLAEYARYDFD